MPFINIRNKIKIQSFPLDSSIFVVFFVSGKQNYKSCILNHFHNKNTYRRKGKRTNTFILLFFRQIALLHFELHVE